MYCGEPLASHILRFLLLLCLKTHMRIPKGLWLSCLILRPARALLAARTIASKTSMIPKARPSDEEVARRRAEKLALKLAAPVAVSVAPVQKAVKVRDLAAEAEALREFAVQGKRLRGVMYACVRERKEKNPAGEGHYTRVLARRGAGGRWSQHPHARVLRGGRARPATVARRRVPLPCRARDKRSARRLRVKSGARRRA